MNTDGWVRLPAHEQLATLRTAMEACGWKRLNGAQWRKARHGESGDMIATTGYVFGEARLHIEDQRWVYAHYEGNDLLYFLLSEVKEPALLETLANLRKVLDTGSALP